MHWSHISASVYTVTYELIHTASANVRPPSSSLFLYMVVSMEGSETATITSHTGAVVECPGSSWL